jgi:hypothetical protein
MPAPAAMSLAIRRRLAIVNNHGPATPAGEVAKAPLTDPGLREGLGGQIESGLTVARPPPKEFVHPFGVSVVKEANLIGILAGREDQLRVGPHRRLLVIGR